MELLSFSTHRQTNVNVMLGKSIVKVFVKSATPILNNGTKKKNNVTAFLHRKESMVCVFYVRETQTTTRRIKNAFARRGTLEMDSSAGLFADYHKIPILSRFQLIQRILIWLEPLNLIS